VTRPIRPHVLDVDLDLSRELVTTDRRGAGPRRCGLPYAGP